MDEGGYAVTVGTCRTLASRSRARPQFLDLVGPHTQLVSVHAYGKVLHLKLVFHQIEGLYLSANPLAELKVGFSVDGSNASVGIV